jgi:hypothetical protein
MKYIMYSFAFFSFFISGCTNPDTKSIYPCDNKKTTSNGMPLSDTTFYFPDSLNKADGLFYSPRGIQAYDKLKFFTPVLH